MRRGSRLALLTGASLLALLAWIAVAGLAHADPADVSVGSASVAPGGSATVGITVSPGAGETVGAASIDVSYSAEVSPTACTPVATCNITFGPNTVRLALANPSGLTGEVGTITFQAVSTGTASLTVTVPVCSDEVGAPLTCTGVGGSITIAVPATPTATPAPEPTPTPTSTPTPTPTGPEQLPETGAEPSGDLGIPWLPVAVGATILAVGGLVLFQQARRVR
jgi:hypothetical protein